MVWIILCGYLLVMPRPAWADTDDPQPTDEHINPAEADRWTQLTTLVDQAPQPESARATFVQERISLLLDEPVRSEGQFFASGKIARLSLTKPEPIEMRFDDQRMQIYYPRDNVLEIYRIPDNSLAYTTGRPDPETLAQNFTLSELNPTNQSHIITLVLTPKGGLTQHLQSLHIRFDTELGLIVGATSVDTAGDQTTMALTDIQTNVEVDESQLLLNVPDDAQVEQPEGIPTETDDR